jgi:hypothetical protein
MILSSFRLESFEKLIEYWVIKMERNVKIKLYNLDMKDVRLPLIGHLDAAISVISRKVDWDSVLKQSVIEQITDYYYHYPHHFFFLLETYNIKFDIFITSR